MYIYTQYIYIYIYTYKHIYTLYIQPKTRIEKRCQGIQSALCPYFCMRAEMCSNNQTQRHSTYTATAIALKLCVRICSRTARSVG